MAKAPRRAIQTQPKAVRICNTDSLHLQTHYVDGATGTITQRNVLRATFYEESYPVPASEEHQLIHQGGNQFGVNETRTIVNPDGVVDINRESKVTLVLTRKGLAQLVPWLAERLTELEAAERADVAGGRET